MIMKKHFKNLLAFAITAIAYPALAEAVSDADFVDFSEITGGSEVSLVQNGVTLTFPAGVEKNGDGSINLNGVGALLTLDEEVATVTVVLDIAEPPTGPESPSNTGYTTLVNFDSTTDITATYTGTGLRGAWGGSLNNRGPEVQWMPMATRVLAAASSSEGTTIIAGNDYFKWQEGALKASSNRFKSINIGSTLTVKGVYVYKSYKKSMPENLTSLSKAQVQNTVDASQIEWEPELASDLDAIMIAEEDAVIDLDQQIAADEIVLTGSGSLRFTGEYGLSFNKATVKADTDVSSVAGSVSLGDVTIMSDKKLTVVQTNVCASINRQANSILKITGDIGDVNDLPLADNCVLETSGNVVLSDQSITETIKGRSWVLSGGESSVSNFYLAAGVEWANSGNRSSLTLKNGAKLTVTGDAAVIGRTKTDGAMMFSECGNGSSVVVAGEGTELKVPNGAINLSRDGASAATVSDGALLQAYKLGGTSNSSTLTIDSATLRLGKNGVQDGVVKMTSCKLVLTNATLSAAGDWSVAAESTASQIEVRDSLTVELDGNNVVLRNMTIFEDVDLIVKGPGVLDASKLTGKFNSSRIIDGAEVIFSAGVEGSADVEEGSTLKLVLSDAQFETTYSAAVSGSGASCFVRWSDNGYEEIADGVVKTDGKLVYSVSEPIWTPVSAGSSWTASALWSSGSIPTSGDIVIDTSAMTEPISVRVPSAFTSVTIRGNDSVLSDVSFDQTPSSITVFGKVKLSVAAINDVETLDIRENVILSADVDEGEVPITKSLSGNFTFVKTGAGILTLNSKIIPYGGTIIEEGTLKFGTEYLGGEQYDSAANVRVKSGAVFDFNGKADSWMHDITLEKESVLRNSGNNIGNGSRQLAGIILEGDATVEAIGDFGLVASGWGNTKLQLNGYCLTKVGSGNFWITKITAVSAGTFRVKEGTLACVSKPSTMTGIKLSIEDNATLSLSDSLSGLASLKFRSNGSGNGVGFNGLQHLNAAIRPVIDAGLVNPESLNVGDTVTLVNGSGLTNNFAEVSVGGRFNEELTEITDAAVTATVGELKNFWHYDFNDGVMSEANAKADDSTYGLSNWGDVNGQDKSIATRNGRAALLYRNSDSQRFSVYWNNNTADKIPFYAGVMTAVSIIKPKATDKRIIWALGSGSNSGAFVALTVDNDNTISMISWANNTLTTLASVSGIKNLTKTFHFVAVEFTPEGTTLQVDDKKVTTDKIFPEGVGKVGQLASVHGNVPGGCGYTRLESGGCYLDDWTVYDAALTDKELKALRSRLTPRPFYIRIR